MSNVTVKQQYAIDTFTVMLERAKAYRNNPQTNDSDLFYPRYGICDNIDRCRPQGSNFSEMSNVKDNVIRRLPSFSGAYHYPVRAPGTQSSSSEVMAEEAERAFDCSGDKWEGEYGAERLQQLTELLEFVKTQWTDTLVTNMTPAQRNGIDTDTVLQHKETGKFYMLYNDDESLDPYFYPLGTPEADRRDNRQSIKLSRLRVLKGENVGNMSVKSFIARIKRKEKEKQKLQAKLNALQEQIDSLTGDVGMLDYELGKQHGVKRLN